MKNNQRVAAVVVTFNRKQLLLECVQAILAQTHKLSRIIIIDNASTDGTEEYLTDAGIMNEPVIDYRKMSKNTGGAGGFYEGIKIASSFDDIDWVWIMDDDTIPDDTALEELVHASEIKENASFFASCVRGMNNEPMNVPVLDFGPSENGYMNWYMDLDHNMVKIRQATFVSLLISAKAIEKCGLPCKDYFIWGDDYEYTMRLTEYYGPAFFVGKSWVCHKRFNAKSISIANEEDPNRIKNYSYFYRNTLFNIYLYAGPKKQFKQYIKYSIESLKILKTKNGVKKFKVMQKGLLESFAKRKHFRDFLDKELGRK